METLKVSGQPAVTGHALGQGRAYYIATRPEPPFLDRLLDLILAELNITAPLAAPEGVEVSLRCIDVQQYIFVLNHHPDEQVIDLPEPMCDLLTGQVNGHQMTLASLDVAILVPASTGDFTI